MKILSIGLALALLAVAGCGQLLDQGSLPSAGAQSVHSAASLGRVRPDTCNFGSFGTVIQWRLS
jgi:hypothetical protein